MNTPSMYILSTPITRTNLTFFYILPILLFLAKNLYKILFQEKPCDNESEYHMKRELGDILWYWVQGCMALNVDPEEVMKMNIEKLKSRYPGGKFDGWFSENRKDGDL